MRSVSLSFLTTAAIQGLNILTGVLAARLLMPEGRGELAAILLWPGIIGALFFMSVDQAVAYYGALRSGTARRIGIAALLATFPFALLAMGIGYLALPMVMKEYDSDAVALSRFFLLSIPFSYAGMVILGTFQGQQSFSTWNIIRLMPSVGYLLSILVFFAFGVASVQGFTLASLLGSAFTSIIGLWLLVTWRGLPWHPRLSDLRILARYSLGVHLPVVASIANRQVDRALVALFLAPEVLGLYVVALSGSGFVLMIGGTIGPIAFARVTSQKQRTTRLHRFGRYFRLTLALTGLSAITLAVIGKWLISAVFGAAFAMAGDLLPLLLIGSFAHAMKQSLYFGLKAHNRLQPISIGEYLSFAVEVGVLFVLLPRIGVMGAAWAVAVNGVVGLTVAGIAMTSVAKINVLRMAVPLPADFRYVWQKISVGRRAIADS